MHKHSKAKRRLKLGEIATLICFKTVCMNGDPEEIAYIAGCEYEFRPTPGFPRDWVVMDERGIKDHHWDYNERGGIQYHFCFPEEYAKPPSDINLWEM